MSKIVWDKAGERLYETGCDHGVLYPMQTGGLYTKGVAWNGLTTVTESPSGAEASPLYADNIKYVNLISNEEFGATIEAYMYPDAFAECDGSIEVMPGMYAGQQNRKLFGLAYRTILGNDTELNEYGYKLHLVYNCLAAPSEKGYSTVNDSPEATTLSWEVSTTPVAIKKLVNGKKLKPTATLTFDSTKFSKKFMEKLEEILYGIDVDDFDASATYKVGNRVKHNEKIYNCIKAVSVAGTWNADNWQEMLFTDARMPMPDEIIELFDKSIVV